MKAEGKRSTSPRSCRSRTGTTSSTGRRSPSWTCVSRRNSVFLPWAPIQDADDIEVITHAARNHGYSPRQIVLAWLLARSPQILPIPGSGDAEHIEANVAAAGIKLDEDEVAAITDASPDHSRGRFSVPSRCSSPRWRWSWTRTVRRHWPPPAPTRPVTCSYRTTFPTCAGSATRGPRFPAAPRRRPRLRVLRPGPLAEARPWPASDRVGVTAVMGRVWQDRAEMWRQVGYARERQAGTVRT